MIYAIADGWAIKIGRTKYERLSHRISEVQTGNPREVRLIAACCHLTKEDLPDPAVEKMLHDHLRAYQLKGGGHEWFWGGSQEVQRIVGMMYGQALAERAYVFHGIHQDIARYIARNVSEAFVREGYLGQLIMAPKYKSLDEMQVEWGSRFGRLKQQYKIAEDGYNETMEWLRLNDYYSERAAQLKEYRRLCSDADEDADE